MPFAVMLVAGSARMRLPTTAFNGFHAVIATVSRTLLERLDYDSPRPRPARRRVGRKFASISSTSVASEDRRLRNSTRKSVSECDSRSRCRRECPSS